MKKGILFSLLLLAIINLASGENILKSKIDSLYNLAWDHVEKNPDSSIFYANIQKELSHKINYELGLVNAYYILGYAYDEALYFDIAASNYYKGLDIAIKKNEYEFKKKQLFLLQCLGIVCEKTFQYDNSLKYAFDAGKIAQEMGNDKALGEIYYNIAVCYRKKGDLDSAVKYHEYSVKISNRTKNEFLKGKVFNSLGLIYDERKERQIAKAYFFKAIKLGKNTPRLNKDLATFQSNLGENYFLQDQYDSAKIYYHQALEISKKYNDTEKMKWIYSNIGDVHFKEKNYREAIAWYQKSIELGNPEAIDAELQRAYQNIARAYDVVEDYKLASQFKSSFIAQANKVAETKERLVEQNAQYRMKEVEWQRQLADKETLLAQLKSWLNSGLAVFALFLIVFGYISRRLYLHYTVHKEMKRILMTPISEELERLERKEKGWDDDSYV